MPSIVLVWWFALRVAIAASYLTLAIAEPQRAGDWAWEFAALVLIVAASDLRTRHQR